MQCKDSAPRWQKSMQANQSRLETTTPGMRGGQIVDHGNMKDSLVTFGNQDYIQYWCCNTKS